MEVKLLTADGNTYAVYPATMTGHIVDRVRSEHRMVDLHVRRSWVSSNLSADVVRAFCRAVRFVSVRVWLLDAHTAAHALVFAEELPWAGCLGMRHKAYALDTHEWTDAQWATYLRASVPYDPSIILCLEDAVFRNNGPSLENLVYGKFTRLQAPSDVLIDWGELRRKWLAGALDLVNTRVRVSSTEVVVCRARGVRIREIALAVLGPSLTWETWTISACGEILENTRTLEAYGLDDETELCVTFTEPTFV